MIELESILKTHFQIDTFRYPQKEVINDVISGKDVFVRFPTGAGKSLCYQLSALVLPGVAVVVSPLISLMKDQVDTLLYRQIPADYINSTVSEKKLKTIRKSAIDGDLKILYISPEGLQKEWNSLITNLNVSLFAIDEAHSISQWGHDFRPEYRELHKLKKFFPATPVLALTASATEDVKKDILSQLGVENAVEYALPLIRPNIRLSVYHNADAATKLKTIIGLYKTYPKGCGIVYCNTRRLASSLANKLSYRGYKAVAYHGGMTRKQRNLVQDQFLGDEAKIICATVAFGMGIDKSDVRWIVHYNIPQNVEYYYQEMGRAGRDGLQSDAILFYNQGDLGLIEDFAQRSCQVEVNLDKLNSIKKYALSSTCRWNYILKYFDESSDPFVCDCDNCRRSRNLLLLDELEMGRKLYHRKFGEGEVVLVTFPTFVAKFDCGEKKFLFPESIQRGYLEFAPRDTKH